MQAGEDKNQILQVSFGSAALRSDLSCYFSEAAI